MATSAKRTPKTPAASASTPPVDESCAVPDATPSARSARDSVFKELGLQKIVSLLKEEIRALYLEDEVPWIIGYSGGKDSTAILQLIWIALAELPIEQRTKTVHVISTDTLVENPIVASWVQKSLEIMGQKAIEAGVPIKPHRLTPGVEDSYWVNLIGRGYPAPRNKFRWCTNRLKIKPSNSFITGIVKLSGEAILVLGTRKAESGRRAINMTKHEKGRMRDRLSPNSSLPGSLVYTPIEDWSNDDVWMFLMQVKNPWGYSNKDLLGMYAGASADGECPLVVDTSTPSCGDSRFGCWVCTLVGQDKSMTAMIRNDEDMAWMEPLLQFRNATDFRWPDGMRSEQRAEFITSRLLTWSHPLCLELKTLLLERAKKPLEEIAGENWERYLRDFRRMNGSVQIFNDDALHGPYLQKARECWLRMLLTAQSHIRRLGPPEHRKVELITLPELQEIRRIWVVDKHEMEDTLPRIYEEAAGQPYPGRHLDDNLVLGADEMSELRVLCGDDTIHYELTRELLSVERQQRSHARRSGLFDQLEKSISRHFYDDKDEAVNTARHRQSLRNEARKDRAQVGDPLQTEDSVEVIA
jgi:DNA sulfur modification protein DndC